MTLLENIEPGPTLTLLEELKIAAAPQTWLHVEGLALAKIRENPAIPVSLALIEVCREKQAKGIFGNFRVF